MLSCSRVIMRTALALVVSVPMLLLLLLLLLSLSVSRFCSLSLSQVGDTRTGTEATRERGEPGAECSIIHSPGENLQAGGDNTLDRDGKFIFEYYSVTMSMRLGAPHHMLTSAPL